jgi:hypothetical protein
MLCHPNEIAVMKTAALLMSASFLFCASAMAQSRAPVNVPPPPGIDDPGTKAVAPARAVSAPAAARQLDLKPQRLPSMQDPGTGTGRDDALPQVSVHQRGEDSVQEYSRNGQVYMVVVTPKNGLVQTYMVDPQGRLVDEHGQRPVRPVMYKVLEWGKAKPATPSSTETPEDDGH